MRLLQGLAFVLALARPAFSAVIHVPADQPTIQAGIDAATTGDTVLIACGTYFESGLVLPPGVVLAGDGSAACAVIDGAHRGPIVTITSGLPNAVVRNLAFRNGSATWGGAIMALGSPTIEGCRFAHNFASDNGGALYGGSVQLLDCEFVGNFAFTFGGAVDLREGSPLVRGCTFRNNTVDRYGGALAVADGEVVDCWFEGNEAGIFGGGMWVDYEGTSLIHFCTFNENSSMNDGGGACTNTCGASFMNCRFERNTAGRNGGGLNVYNSDIPTAYCVFLENHADHMGGGYAGDSGAGDDHASTLENCTFWGNSAGAGGGVAGTRAGYPSFEKCIVAGSTQGGAFAWETALYEPYLACCDLWGNVGGDWTGRIADIAEINGNFTADPLFCSPAMGNFTIDADSPCAPPGITECGLVGALPVDCGIVSVVEDTWARIKARYHSSP